MFKNFLGNKANTALTIEQRKSECMREAVPSHIAIIMDGNGRWAKKRALPRVAGHREGMKTVKKITRCASDIGVEALTVYAFSTENWKRDPKEVSDLMNLLREYLAKLEKDNQDRNARICVIGDITKLDIDLQDKIISIQEKTKDNMNKLTINNRIARRLLIVERHNY